MRNFIDRKQHSRASSICHSERTRLPRRSYGEGGRNLLLANRGLRGFSLLNFPRKISSVYWHSNRRQPFSCSFAKQKVATLSEAWRLVVNLSPFRYGQAMSGQLPRLDSSIRLVAPVGTNEAATVTSTSLWANTWVWVRLVDPRRGTSRNEPDDDYHEVDIAFVS